MPSDPKFPTHQELAALQDKRDAALKELKALHELATAEKRSLTAVEQKRWDEFMVEQKSLLQQIDTAALAREQARAGLKVGGGAQPGESWPGSTSDESGPVFGLRDGSQVRALRPTDRLAAQVPAGGSAGDGPLALGRLIRGMTTGNWDGADAEKRAMGALSGALGGFLVPPALSSLIIDLARAQSVVIRAGGLTIPMPTGEMTVVRVTADPQGQWRPEHVKIEETDAAFEPIKLKAMTLGALTRLSIELIEDAQMAGDQVERALAASLGLQLDRAALFGTGVNEPRGIANTAGVSIVDLGTNGAVLGSYSNLSLAVQLVLMNNGAPNAAILHPRDWGSLDRLVDGQLQPLSPPASWADLALKLVSTQLPINLIKGSALNTSNIIVGDFRQVAIAMRTNITIEATRTGDSDSFSKLQVLIRAYLRADVAVLRPTHFCKILGILP